MLPLLPFVANPALDLWPEGNPGGWGRTDAEKSERGTDGVLLVKNVSRPTLEFFRASRASAHAPTVIVIPGGGYYAEAIDHEGWEVARRLNREGFHAAVLKYRLPNRDVDRPLYRAPLQDAQRAIRLVRSRAAEWRVDPRNVGVLGFSAGGHLAATVATTSEATYAPVDEADRESPKPAFAALVYPAYLTPGTEPEGGAALRVPADAPPAFVVQTMDDALGVGNALAYVTAAKATEASVEAHLFPKGGHGYGLRSEEPGVKAWPELLAAWLRRLFPR